MGRVYNLSVNKRSDFKLKFPNLIIIYLILVPADISRAESP